MSGDLCISCAMCCDGTIFDVVRVTPEERDRLGGGEDFGIVDGLLTMQLPCRRLGADGACTCYSDRPQRCMAFKCDLLRSVESGETPHQVAQVLVAHTKALRGPAMDALMKTTPEAFRPPGRRASRWMQALQDAKDAGAEIDEDDFDWARTQYLAFFTHVAMHFRDPDHGRQDDQG